MSINNVGNCNSDDKSSKISAKNTSANDTYINDSCKKKRKMKGN